MSVPKYQGLYFRSPQVFMGCDPELFFEKGGEIIGAEKVLGKEGRLRSETWLYGSSLPANIVLDGVQVELNPAPQTCRCQLGSTLAQAFRTLKAHLATLDGVKASFSSVVEVKKEELDTLSDKAKELGCKPSQNFYNSSATINVNPKTYRKRSAAGHIHLGLDKYAALMVNRQKLIPILDYILGNTCVLIDRDPLSAERRQVYGRAGEYRLPEYGIEYRTLSNFWLRAYPLMSFVMGMARQTCGILWQSETARVMPSKVSVQLDEELFTLIPSANIERAINNNDLDLARENFEKIKPFIVETFLSGVGLYDENIPWFEHFVDRTVDKGLSYWFPQDPIEHWCSLRDCNDLKVVHGWEQFLANEVVNDKGKEVASNGCS